MRDGVRHSPVRAAACPGRTRRAVHSHESIRVGLRAAVVVAALLAPAFAASGQGSFVESASARGLAYTVTQGAFGGAGQFGCGVLLADLDGDGDDDAVVSGAANERLGFFRNDGGGHFTDVSLATGLGPISKASGIAAADYDGDGDLDLAVTRWIKPTVLLRNEGGLEFVDATAGSGIFGSGAGAGCAWGDYDGDGWLDLAVANRVQTLFNFTRNKLWRNQGDGTFVEVGAKLGLDNGGFPAFMVSWCDVDGDGDLDLYVANDKGGTSPFWNRLFRNNGDGTFFEDFECRADVNCDAMGTSYGDLDHDGVPEILVPNVTWGNFLLRSGDGGNSYLDLAPEAGVEAFGTCWGAAFMDVENDGDTDLFIASSSTDNFMYLHGASWPLFLTTAWSGLSNTAASYCVAQADVDSDGDVDLLVQDWQQPVKLYLNQAPATPSRRWIELRAMGRGPNTHGVGTRLVARSGVRSYWRQVASGTDYKSQSSYRQHLGLGSAKSLAELEVFFPKAGALPAATRVLRNLPAGHEWPLWPPERLGDLDGDGVRGDGDRAAMAKSLGGAFTPAGAILDFDGDADVDADDLSEFDRVQCDLDGDGRVGAKDLAILLARWGGAGADFDDDGATGEADLARLLDGWTG